MVRYRIFTRRSESDPWAHLIDWDDAYTAAYTFLQATQGDGSGYLTPDQCALGDGIATDLDAGCAFERTDFHGVTGLLVRSDSPACPSTATRAESCDH